MMCLVRTSVAAELTCDPASVPQQEINTGKVPNSASIMCSSRSTIAFYTDKICGINLQRTFFHQLLSIRWKFDSGDFNPAFDNVWVVTKDDAVRVLNFATSKILLVKSVILPQRSIHTYHLISSGVKNTVRFLRPYW